jgi:exopolysaccharide production protein ExoQ
LSYIKPARTEPALQVRRLPWLFFLLLSVTFILYYHDTTFLKNGTGNYNLSQGEIVTGRVNGSLVHRIAMIMLGVIAVVSLIRHRNYNHLRLQGPFGWILLSFVAWTFISPIWSAELPWTLKSLVGCGILCIATAAVVRRLSIREIILWIFFSKGLSLLVGISAEMLFGAFRPLAPGYRFSGGVHPNSQGIDCGLLLLSAVALAHVERRWRRLLYSSGFVAFFFLILTASRTALAATLLALVSYGIAVLSRRSKIMLAFSFSTLTCVLLLLLGAGLLPGLKSAALLGRGDADSVDSFSGRIEIWQDVGHYIRQRPILGYGYGAFWTPVNINTISGEENAGIPNGHSAYIDTLLTLGTVGFIEYVCLLFVGIMQAFRYYRHTRHPGFTFCVALLVFVIVDGGFESTYLAGGTPMFILMLVLALLAFYPIQRHPHIANL